MRKLSVRKLKSSTLGRVLRARDGATMVEYALLAALIAVVVSVTATTLGGSIKTKFTTISTTV